MVNTDKARRFKKIHKIFEQAIDLDSEERQTFIRESSEGDEKLERKIIALLAAAVTQTDNVNDALDRSISSLIQPEDRSNETIGHFKLIKKIGEGGMGEVYLARRNDNEFRQEVAIKIIRTMLQKEHLESSFNRERQILADLNHPNICRLLDGGTTVNNESYFVMEYIEGVTLDQYYSQNQLTLRQKITLFQKICDAVQTAHQHLVVHCDLKPNNILVTPSGDPKLLDFGVARALSSEGSLIDSNEFTPLTYNYACPALLKGEKPTLASDVFSLGIVLTELLSGNHPEHIGKTALNKIKSYRSSLTQTKPNASLKSAMEEISKSVRDKDLKSICSKASHFQAKKRYQTVADFKSDISRYLNGYPVAAASPSPIRRLFYWIKRKKMSIAIVSFMTLTLSFWALRENQLREEAQQEASIRTQVTHFLIDLFSEASPGKNRGKEASVREIVDIGTTKLLSNNSIQSDVRIELLRSLKSVNNSLGHYKKGQELSQQAVELQLQFDSDNHLQLGLLYTELAGGYYNQDNFKLARDWYEKAMMEWEQLPFLPMDAYHTYAQYSQLLRKNGFPEQALDFISKAFDIAEKHNLEGLKMEALNTKSITLDVLGRTEESIKIYEDLLPLNEKLTGKSSPSYFINLLNYGLMLKDLSRIEDAKKSISEALSLAKSTYPKGHPDVGYIHDSMGSLYLDIGEYKEAESHLVKSRQSQLDFDRKHSMDFVLATSNLGSLYEEWEEFEKAKDLYQMSLAIKKTMFPGDHIQIAHEKRRLGNILRKLNEFDSSQKNLNEALRIYNKYSSKSQSYFTLRLLGLLSVDRGNIAKATEYFSKDQSPKSKRMRRLALKHYHNALLNIASKNFPGAKQHLKIAISAMIDEVDETHPLVAKYRLELALVDYNLENIAEAKELFSNNFNRILEVFPHHGPTVQKANRMLELLKKF